MVADWPHRSMSETYDILTARGGPFEMEECIVGGQALRCYVHAHRTMRDVFDQAAQFDKREALVYEDERVSFAGLRRAAAHVSRFLSDDHGIKKGDRVAIAMRNMPEWAAAFWAIIGSGRVVVPLNAWWGADELDFAIKDSGAKLVFVDEQRLAILETTLRAADIPSICARSHSGGSNIVGLDDIVGPVTQWDRLPDLDLADVSIETDDPATIFYTSGTTGRPKGALGTHRNMATNIVNVGLRFARAALRRGDPIPEPDPSKQRTTLLPTPLFHVTGTHSGIVPAMASGTRVVLMYKWAVDDALGLIERERVNTLVTVPAMAWQIVKHDALGNFDLNALDTLTYGGAPAGKGLLQHLESSLPGRFFASGFGMTETSSVISSNSAEDLAKRPDSVGTIMPCNDIRIVDEASADVAPGMAGELLVRGPNVIARYWGNPADTDAGFDGHWFRTGDIVSLDSEGFLYVLDRAKDMLIRGGENIYCVEIEDILLSHPSIEECSVIGVPHEVLGEEVGVVIRFRPGCDCEDEAIRRFVAERLAGFKVPAHIFRRDQPLPRNIGGKVLKRELRRDFIDGQAN